MATQVPNVNSNGFVYVDATEVTSGLYDYANFTRGKCRKYLQAACKELEEYMKTNHPWENRTGQAEANLSAEYSEQGGGEYIPKELIITISHGVEYGIFLEYNGLNNLAYLSRRRPILEPTKERMFPEILERMEGILDVLAW